jgi:sorbitol-6-phosphate 2-dehydrogenase
MSASEDCRKLVGKVAMVTGGAQGLGAALCHRLAREGAHVGVCDINAEGCQAVAAEIAREHGVQAVGVPCDVTDEATVQAAVEGIVEALGGLDILVANAGILISGALTDFDVAAWRKVIDVDLVGFMIPAKHAARVMLARGGGVIVQVNSKSGKRGSFRNSAYAAAKFGGIGLVQSLALEFATENIRVNAVCPGNLLESPLWRDKLFAEYAQRWGLTEEEVRQKYIDQVPMKRGCAYDDVCDVVVFLCAEDSRYMTGQALNVDGGQTMQ